MNRYYYDFHIHSCLSPCGDNDMTPNNIAGMATLCGLNIVALTDHNTTKNCPAFFAAAKQNGIIPIAGMELTTVEDIHVVCLLEHLEQAMAFDSEVEKRRILIKNKVEIFGDQLICDGKDNVIGTEKYLLSNATTISIDEALEFTESRGGICFPAHIDRDANGIICILGTFPQFPPFNIAEFRDMERRDQLAKAHPALEGKLAVSGSDAHYLWDMRDKSCYFDIEDEPYSGDLVRHNLFEILRRGAK